MSTGIQIGGRRIGAGEPVFVVAELSGNHHHDLDCAIGLVQAAKEAGADAVKLQTYTPETMTLRSDDNLFRIGKGTLWEGRNLYDLYAESFTPWEWYPELSRLARDLGMILFSTPFDATAVAFLEEMDTPAYKVASFELVDIPLLSRIAMTGKPVILSTGMATRAEVEEAVGVLRAGGVHQLALLKCTSAYPAEPTEMNLKSIPALAEAFEVPVGLSDHSLTTTVPVTAVALGACIIEKHLTLSRAVAGPDSEFSLEPHEFRAMVEAVRTAQQALGEVVYGPGKRELASLVFRRSLFVTAPMQKGEVFTRDNLRAIRPGYGLHTRHLDQIVGRRASRDIPAGTPLAWELVDNTFVKED